MNNIDSTKEDIKEIFKILNINKVVSVDDDFEETSVENIIYSQNRDLLLKQFFPEITIDDEEIRSKQIREQWEKTDKNTRRKISMTIKVDNKELSERNKMALEIFLNIVPDEMLFPLSPSQWDETKEELLKNSNGTLFLFDQDLKKESGRGEDGIKIIAELSKEHEIISGLLTHTATKDDCMQRRDELSVGHDISKDKFLVIPKENLNDNLPLFIYLLKMTILSKDFIPFKKYINDILESVYRTTKGNINEIGVEDFDHIIFKAPRNEGLWEPDMFFRIYSNFQRREFNKLVHSVTDLEKTIGKIRSVSGISTKPISFLTTPSKAWEIQHDEFYESGEYLNKNHLPIEVGDIFEKTTPKSTNKYILLSQACDLMLRQDGKRARESIRFTLLRMKRVNGEEEKSNKQFIEDVWYYGSSHEERWIVNFKDVSLVKDCILDLCVYNGDGVSRYTSNNELSDDIRPSLEKRYDKIISLIKKGDKASQNIIKELKGQQSLNTEKLYKSVYETIFRDDLFKSKYEKKGDNFTLTFDCKRIGRLIYERAAGLLAEYYSVMQRPAFEPDYGNSESDE